MAFECRTNCGMCCGPVPIKKETYEKNKNRAKPHYVVDLGTHVLALQGTDEKPSAKCAFLQDDAKCAIYEERPPICRVFGQTNALPCPFLHTDGTPRNRESRREVERIEDRQLKRLKKKTEE